MAIKNFLFVICLTFLWGIHFIYNTRYQWHLPSDLVQKPVQVIGVVDSVPQKIFHGLKFHFYVKKINNHRVGAHVILSWYQHPQNLVIGQQWAFWVRLKPPVGLHNPGGFNYQKWLVYHGIGATGYVINRFKQKKLGDVSNYQLARLRLRIESNIMGAVSDPEIAAVLSALSVGLRDQLKQTEWQVFQKTGTSHLVAISGLHIGLVASAIFLLVQFIWRQVPVFMRFCPAIRAGQIACIIAALVYTILSGFALPAQRAVIMIFCVMFSSLFYFRLVFSQRLLLAFTIIMLLQPVAIFSASLGLSFFAVSVLGYLLCARLQTSRGWVSWGRIQLALFFSLMPVSLWYFHQTSLVALVANAIAIPWISFIVVPSILLGVVIFLCGASGLGHDLFYLSGLFLKPLWWFLQKLSHYQWSAWHHDIYSPWILAASLLAVFLVVAPKGLPGKWLGCFGLLPLFIYHPKQPEAGDFWVTVLDVGQGLSVLIQTKTHAMLYDAGAHIPNGFDMGASVVLPYLRHQGILHLNMMMISHGDNDHSGGAAAIFKSMIVDSFTTSAPRVVAQLHGSYCHAGQSWRWDGVEFMVLSPQNNKPYQDNNSSCVLKIKNKTGAILLTGDIEKSSEEMLVQSGLKELSATVLVVPHHGSMTSSTMPFIKAVSPKIAVISLGQYNRYHFPSQIVMSRYLKRGVHVYTTAKNGAIHIRFLHLSQVVLAQ